MKVFIVYSVGADRDIYIEKVFDSLGKAELFIKNRKLYDSSDYGILEEEVY